MGAPKRNRKKYDKPKDMWNLERIGTDNKLLEEYGLKNMRELWKAQTQLSTLRSNVRDLLSGSLTNTDLLKEQMISRLSRYGIASPTATLDQLLDLDANAFLSRRLQSIVFKKGLAKTPKQARQLIVHGFISVGGRRVNRPGYIVSTSDERQIGYYRNIDLGIKEKREEAQAIAAEQPASATAPEKPRKEEKNEEEK